MDSNNDYLNNNKSEEVITTSHNINNLEDFYAKWSTTYDNDVLNCNYVGPHSIVELLIRKFNIYGSKIIDIGCGTGLLSNYLDRFKYQIEVDGLDFSNEMLEISKTKDYYTSLIQKDVYEITGDNNQEYDFAVSIGMFTHNHVKPKAIRNILHYLTHEGVFIFTVRESFCINENFDKIISDLRQEKIIKDFEKYDAVQYIKDEDCFIFILYKA